MAKSVGFKKKKKNPEGKDWKLQGGRQRLEAIIL